MSDDDGKSELLSIDKEQLKVALQAVVEREVTAVVKLAMEDDGVAAVIRGAFNKTWRNERDTWLEENIKNVTSNILYQAVLKSLEDAGIPALVDAAIKDFIATDEFKDQLKERALQTVKETTFYVRPDKEGDDNETA